MTVLQSWGLMEFVSCNGVTQCQIPEGGQAVVPRSLPCMVRESGFRPAHREHISHTPLQSSNKAEPTLVFKPRGDITRNPKQGYQWPQKWTCVQKNF